MTDEEPPATPAAPARTLEDLLGGRVLAWVGGLSVLAGVALLFAMAVSRGWLGEGARTVLGSLGALALGAIGVWLHERRGRTEAALAAVAASSGALFLAVTVASRVYGLVSPATGIGLAIVVGVTTTALALRWDAPVIGAFGLLGGVAAPLLAGASLDGPTVAMLAVAAAAATAVCVRKDWAWLSATTFALALPQWGAYVLGDAGTAGVLMALVCFGALSAAGAVGHDLRRKAERLRGSSAWLVCAGALAVAAAGWFGLDRATGASAGDAWLAALAGLYLAAGIAWRRAPRVGAEISLLALTLGVVLADVAIARVTDGLPTAIAWLGGGLACAAMTRVSSRDGDRQTAGLGLGAHLGLGILQALTTDAAPGSGAVGVAGTAVLLAIAATCLVARWIVDDRERAWRPALDLVAVAAVSYLTALNADGTVLVVAWAAESAALATLWRRTGEPAAGIGAVANLALALGHALIVEAPATALVGGVAPLAPAVIALVAVGAAAAMLGHRCREAEHRRFCGALAAGLALYTLSVIVVSVCGTAGQPALSATWALTGVVALVLGLRTDRRSVRLGALALLALAAAKVFVLDLARLDAAPRVASFLALGLLLLAGAFAWQRARPAEQAPGPEGA